MYGSSVSGPSAAASACGAGAAVALVVAVLGGLGIGLLGAGGDEQAAIATKVADGAARKVRRRCMSALYIEAGSDRDITKPRESTDRADCVEGFRANGALTS